MSAHNNYSGYTDEALMELYRLNHNVRAFEELYSRHSSLCYGYLVKRVQNEAIAQDILQTAFLKLHQSRDKYDSKLPFLPWFFVVIKNTLMDHFRKSRNEEKKMMDAYLDSGISKEDPLEIEDLLQQVSPKYQQALRMRYLEDLDFDVIAEKLKISTVNVRKIISRALAELRESLRKNNEK